MKVQINPQNLVLSELFWGSDLKKHHFQRASAKQKEPVTPSRRSRLCALCVWLVADYNLEFDYAEFGFFLTPATVQRKIQKYGVLIDFDFCLAAALRARKPE